MWFLCYDGFQFSVANCIFRLHTHRRQDISIQFYQVKGEYSFPILFHISIAFYVYNVCIIYVYKEITKYISAASPSRKQLAKYISITLTNQKQSLDWKLGQQMP